MEISKVSSDSSHTFGDLQKEPTNPGSKAPKKKRWAVFEDSLRDHLAQKNVFMKVEIHGKRVGK